MPGDGDMEAATSPGRPAPSPLALEARIGIMQGRLVPSATGELECSVGSRWREEFSIAATLGLSHIELVADRAVDLGNPIWSDDGRDQIVAVAEGAGVHLASLCVNESLATPFRDVDLALDLANRLAPVVTGLHLSTVVLPLLEASDLRALDWADAARCVSLVAEQLSDCGTRLVLELGIPAVDSAQFLGRCASMPIGLCYDVGNATALRFDAAAELRTLGPSVWHLHAKDKSAAGENVRFGTGKVPFVSVMAALADQGFAGLITMEATRGVDPIITAAEHRAFLLAMEELASQIEGPG